jgi:SAM-dependent methyltransferase
MEVDPVVSQFIAATNGRLYVPLIGRLSRYPIPPFPFPGKGSLLDLGCGWGRWTFSAIKSGYTAVGVDPQEHLIQAAGRVNRQLGYSAEFIRGDGRSLPFDNDTFDCIFSFSVLQHFAPDQLDITLAEMARVLRPNGRVYVQMAHKFGLRSFYYQARRGFRTARDFEVRYYSISELKQRFQVIGHPHCSVHAFFGLGLEPSDMDLMLRRYRLLIRLSQAFKKWGLFSLADSVYLQASKDSN